MRHSASVNEVQGMDIDDALRKVGGYRRWHLAVFVGISVSVVIPLATQNLNIVFIGYPSPHQCTLPPGVDRNITIPMDPETLQPSSCSVYVNVTVNNDTENCPDGWDYYTQGETSIVTEWDLVCGDAYLPELTQVIYQLGAMVGDIAGAMVTDHYGRKWTHATSYVFVVACGAGLAYSPNFYAFAALRFFIAIAVACGYAAGSTLLMELFDVKRRAFPGIIVEFTWVAGYMYTGFIGWLLRDWRKMQLVCSLSAMVGFTTILIPESPLWLEANGRVEEAEEVLQKIARYNGVHTHGPLLFKDDDLLETSGLESEDRNKKQYQQESNTNIDDVVVIRRESVLDLLRDPLLLKFTIIASALWFCNNLVFYFMILSSASIAGERFSNYFLSGAVEIPAVFVTYYFVRKSRCILTSVFHICAGVCLVILAFLPAQTANGVDLTYLVLTMSLLGKFFITCSFNVIVLYTKELFPTNLRAISAGVVLVLGRLGNMGAPFASYMVRSKPWVINVSLGILSILVAMATLLLPETKDWPFPQSIEDVHTFTRGRPRARSRRVSRRSQHSGPYQGHNH